METVEVVIRIPKMKYDVIMETGNCGLSHNERAIKHGIVLPKGHGGLIDYDDIISEYIKRIHSYMSEEERMNLFCTIVDEAKVVIEADKEVDG